MVLLFKPHSYQTVKLLSVLKKQFSLQKQSQVREGLLTFLKNKKPCLTHQLNKHCLASSPLTVQHYSLPFFSAHLVVSSLHTLCWIFTKIL